MGVTESRFILQHELPQALSRQQLFLLFQPCLDLDTGRIISTEALLRWRHPRRGVIVPDVFVPISEHQGSIVEIGKWVLQAACAQTRRWHDAGLTWLRTAINVSSVQLEQPGFASDVAEVLDATGLDARFLEIEITETAFIRDIDTVANVLRALKRVGVAIAIDDFGVGYSWLSRLQQFPVDILKIDKSFIQDIAGRGRGRIIVRSLIQLARMLNLTVVAEGVERQCQYRFLQEQRCDRVQGFLIGRPVEAETIVPLAIAAPCRAGTHTRPPANVRAPRSRSSRHTRTPAAWHPKPAM
jgi:EAL domain-containing protein (putative c-di-GMP-specific phosphodiesterase class I)